MAITAVQNVIFDVDCESSNFGKLFFTDLSDYAGQGIDPDDVQGTWTVTFPDGDSAIVQIDPNVSTSNASVSIPLDANGDYMTGGYVFLYSITVSGAIQPGTYTQTINYDFCPALKLVPGSCTVPCIEIEVNCFCLKITASDETKYGQPANITREITLYPPPPLSLPSESTSGQSIVYNFSYTGGYTVEVNTSVGYSNTTNNVGIAARVKGSIFKDIKCDRDLCSLYNCIKKLYESLAYKAGTLGGWDKLPMEQRELWISVLSLSELFDHALKCGDYNDADKYYDELKDLVDCDCGCQKGTGPRLVNPYCGGAPGNGNTVVVAGSGNVTVSSNTVGSTTTYTVGLSSGFLALITQMQNDITALQGDITNINNTISALPPKQYYKLYDSAGVAENIGNTSEQTLRSYTLPINTLAIGDTLIAEAEFRLAVNTNAKTVKLLYGATGTTLALGSGPSAQPVAVTSTVLFTIRITKTASNQVLREVSGINGLGTPTVVSGPRADYPTDANASGAVLISATGQSPLSGVAGDVNCTRLTVELIKAP